MDKYKWNTSALSITSGQVKKEETLLGSARAVAMDIISTKTDGRDSRNTVRVEAEVDTGETGTCIIGRQVKKMDSGE